MYAIHPSIHSFIHCLLSVPLKRSAMILKNDANGCDQMESKTQPQAYLIQTCHLSSIQPLVVLSRLRRFKLPP